MYSWKGVELSNTVRVAEGYDFPVAKPMYSAVHREQRNQSFEVFSTIASNPPGYELHLRRNILRPLQLSL